jgi:hypothetical protein
VLERFVAAMKNKLRLIEVGFPGDDERGQLVNLFDLGYLYDGNFISLLAIFSLG